MYIISFSFVKYKISTKSIFSLVICKKDSIGCKIHIPTHVMLTCVDFLAVRELSTIKNRSFNYNV